MSNDDGHEAQDERALALIEEEADTSIRRLIHEGRMFFAVVDVVAILTGSANPGSYWRALKMRLKEEEFRKLLTQCRQLKLPASDGKLREIDCADFATIISLVRFLPAVHRRGHNNLPDHSIAGPHAGIYAIINTLTQEQYIGSSMDITNRFMQHKTLLRRGKHHAHRLQEAWNTYGEEAFLFEVLEELNNSAQLEELEQQYLDEDQPVYNGATVALNSLTRKPVSEERVQEFLLFFYETFGPARTNADNPSFRILQDSITYGVVKPGPKFDLLLQAEADGIASWEDFRILLQQQQTR